MPAQRNATTVNRKEKCGKEWEEQPGKNGPRRMETPQKPGNKITLHTTDGGTVRPDPPPPELAIVSSSWNYVPLVKKSTGETYKNNRRLSGACPTLLSVDLQMLFSLFSAACNCNGTGTETR